MNARRAFIPFALLTAALPSCASADTDHQIWLPFLVNVRFASGWRLFGELQPRIGENDSRLTQFESRLAVGKQLTKDFSLWLGYGWTPSFRPHFNSEDLYYAQALWEERPGAWSFSNRTRLELRQIAGTFGTSVRLRDQIRGSVPFRPKSPWSAVASNELFFVFNDTPKGPQNGFDQDRLFAGLGYQLSKETRMEFGYQAVFIERPRIRRLDVLQVSLYLTF